MTPVNKGELVEVRQFSSWLPFLVTHVSEDHINGVAFSGVPDEVGWGNRAAQAFSNVHEGEDHLCWRKFQVSAEPEPEPEKESAPELDLDLDPEDDDRVD